MVIVNTFDTEDDAIVEANGTDFGLFGRALMLSQSNIFPLIILSWQLPSTRKTSSVLSV